MKNPAPDFYRTYSEHKQWVHVEAHRDDRFYQTLLRGIELPGKIAILEIGFGSGDFMDWARAEGHDISGVEILPEMVKHAQSRGHKAYLGPLENVDFAERQFDLLIAIDVVEHLSISELMSFFESADRLLSAQGKIVMRFPNGSSPMAGAFQHGDVTHKLFLSKEAFEQICTETNFRVIRSIRHRSYPANPAAAIRRWVIYRVRDALELFIGYLYFGYRKNLDPNEILLCARRL